MNRQSKMFRMIDSQLAIFNSTIWKATILSIDILVVVWLLKAAFNAFYNVFLHPLKNYPGPVQDIAFPLLSQWDVYKGWNVHRVHKLHEQYGEVVRLGPNSLSYISPEAWKDIYGYANDLPKPGASIGFAEGSLFTAAKNDHARMRKVLSPAFSEKSLLGQERLIRVYVDLLRRRLQGLNGDVTDTVKWFHLLAFDITGDLVFGHSLEGLETGETNVWIDNVDKLVQFIPLISIIEVSKIFQILFKLFLGPPIKAAKIKQDTYIKKLLAERMTKHDRGDFMDHIMNKMPENEIVANADLLMAAGSHTASVLMSGLVYYIGTTPHVYSKLTQEVRSLGQDQISFTEISGLPYLQAVIQEALRMFTPVAGGLPRKTINPTMVCGKIVPAGTEMSVTHLAAYYSETNFHRATEFLPERWLKDAPAEFLNDRRDVFHPFNHGPRDCIGKNLAYHQIRLVIAKLLWNFDIVIEEESLNWKDQRIFGMWELPPLKVRYVDRVGTAEEK